MFRKIMSFFKSVQGELKFVSWPSKDDIKEGTTVVILMSALVAIFLSLVDAGFGFLIKNLLLG